MTKRKVRELDRVDLLAFPEHGAEPYVQQFLQDRGYSVMPDCSIVRDGATTVPASEITVDLHQTHFRDRCILQKRLDESDRGMPKPFTEKILEGGLDLTLFRRRDEQLAETLQRLAFQKDSTDEALRAFVAAVAEEPSELTVAVLKHWMANVKKRMLGRAVEYHVFPILVGKQGGGKSTALLKLLSPLRWYTMHLSSVLTLSDERNFKSISEKYVCVLDEMARADKTDAQILKGLITAETLSARALGTNRRDRLVANCSYVGTSNMPVQDIIYDPSGMRRFFELRCQAKMNWKAIDETDYTSVWRSVDEAKDHLEHVRAELLQHQEEIREPNQVELFIEEKGIAPGEAGNPAHRVTSTEIHENYIEWADKFGRKNFILDKRALGKRMGELGFLRWRSKGSRGWWVQVPGVIAGVPSIDRSSAEASLEDLTEERRRGTPAGWKRIVETPETWIRHEGVEHDDE